MATDHRPVYLFFLIFFFLHMHRSVHKSWRGGFFFYLSLLLLLRFISKREVRIGEHSDANVVLMSLAYVREGRNAHMRLVGGFIAPPQRPCPFCMVVYLCPSLPLLFFSFFSVINFVVFFFLCVCVYFSHLRLRL